MAGTMTAERLAAQFCAIARNSNDSLWLSAKQVAWLNVLARQDNSGRVVRTKVHGANSVLFMANDETTWSVVETPNGRGLWRKDN